MARKNLSINEIAADLDALELKDRNQAKKDSVVRNDKISFSKREAALKSSLKEEAKAKEKEQKEQREYVEAEHIEHKKSRKERKREELEKKDSSRLSTSKLDNIQRDLDLEEKKGVMRKKDDSDTKKKESSRPTRKEKQRARKLRNGQILRKYLDKAGYEDLKESTVIKRVVQIAIIICFLITIGVIVYSALNDTGVRAPLIVSLGIWTGALGGILVLSWVGIYFFLDMRIYNRTMQIEEAFPDYLQLASANISAGMPIDRALWFAVRPRFGVLAKEMETVAKSTLSGEDIPDALRAFANKYDSTMIRRSISLLLEGMDAGGEVASLLNKVSINIQETRILKKEMAANVMTYAIFIGFASVAAGPIMYALSGQLLKIIQGIMAMMAESSGGNMSTGMFSLSVTGSSITPADFQIFALITVFLTSMFSAFIVSSIRKGNIKSGMKSLPVFIGASVILYFVASWVLGKLLGGISAF